jgi:hypothetical protein
MDTLSDFIGRKQPPEGNGTQKKSTDFMNMRKLQPNENLIEKLRSSQASHTAGERGIDLLIRGLVDLLPKPDTIWPIEDRAKWLRLAAGIFDLGYKGDGEPGEISIVAVKQLAAKPRQ